LNIFKKFFSIFIKILLKKNVKQKAENGHISRTVAINSFFGLVIYSRDGTGEPKTSIYLQGKLKFGHIRFILTIRE